MPHVLFWVAIICAAICVGLYVYLTVKVIPAASKETSKAIRDIAPSTRSEGVSAQDFAELIKAIASLVEQLVKAGPALWALVGSMVFLLIAALAAGLIIKP